METGLQRKVHADHVTVLETKDGAELPPNGLAEEAVLHGREPHDGRRQHRVGTAGHGGDVQHRVVTGQGVEAVVVAEGPFDPQVGGVGPPFDDDVRLSGDPQVLRGRFGQGKTSTTEDACELVLRQVVGKREMAEKISSGGPPRQIATGIFSPAAAWSAPCL